MRTFCDICQLPIISKAQVGCIAGTRTSPGGVLSTKEARAAVFDIAILGNSMKGRGRDMSV
jgi:hypothetical protein